ncbi:MAG: sulfotransferase [Candidatus Thiodiazotropha sp. (ex Ustalcina ferruginea)]|nr:sulfotransferase [Candidatus Thiodiazotropha sp. (ex Ustalcina ferruginea)]
MPKLLALGEQCTCGSELRECAEWGRVFSELASSTGVDLRVDPYGLYLDDAMKRKDGSGKIDHRRQTIGRVAIARFRGAMDTLGLALPAAIGGAWASLPSVKSGMNNTMMLFSAATKVWNKEMVIDASKLPRKAIHLYRAFPDEVRILHLTRDGRGVCASRMAHMSFERAAKRWQHYHRITTRLLDRWVDPDRRFFLRYEDFTVDPERWMKQLCAWMGVSFEPQMLVFNSDGITHSAGGNPTRFKLADEGIRPADDNWRSKLSAVNIAQFETLAGSINRQLGYR